MENKQEKWNFGDNPIAGQTAMNTDNRENQDNRKTVSGVVREDRISLGDGNYKIRMDASI